MTRLRPYLMPAALFLMSLPAAAQTADTGGDENVPHRVITDEAIANAQAVDNDDEGRGATEQNPRPTRDARGSRGPSRRGGGPFGASGGSTRLSRTELKIGSPLPRVTVLDAEGNAFDLQKEMRGTYAVLVFGCLT